MSQHDDKTRDTPPFSRPAAETPEAVIAREQERSSEEVVVEEPVKARQGFLGVPVAVVLGASLLLALIAWIMLYAV